jgi:hypothetical protein
MIKQVAVIVIAGVILLFCTTFYNLLLAHIWPVTMQFGAYSWNNIIFMLVAILSSLLLVIIILALEMLYIFNLFGHMLSNLLTSPEKRKPRKHRWFEYILDALLLAASGIFNLCTWVMLFFQERRLGAQPASSPTPYANTATKVVKESLAKRNAVKQHPPTPPEQSGTDQQQEEKTA